EINGRLQRQNPAYRPASRLPQFSARVLFVGDLCAFSFPRLIPYTEDVEEWFLCKRKVMMRMHVTAIRDSKTKYLLIAAGLLCLFAVVLLLPQQAQAKGFSINKIAMEKTVTKYDVNGNGNNDTVEFTKTGKFKASGETLYKQLIVSINGTETPLFQQTHGFASASAELVTLKNGARYIWLTGAYGLGSDDEDMDPWNIFYKCNKKDKLVIAVKCDKYVLKFGSSEPNNTVLGGKGNKVTVTENLSLPFDSTRVQFTYKYKGGKLKLASKAGKVVGSGTSKKPNKGNLVKAQKLYAKPMAKKSSTTLAKNTKVTYKKVYISKKALRVQVKSSTGKTGWIRCAKNSEEPLLSYV
ncbi:MAG: hypothetical protein LUD25_04535, partial [Coriobacteriaceae bacterium]|nr:hypothetical protein [Coriobacteriaceae bacterium]